MDTFGKVYYVVVTSPPPSGSAAPSTAEIKDAAAKARQGGHAPLIKVVPGAVAAGWFEVFQDTKGGSSDYTGTSMIAQHHAAAGQGGQGGGLVPGASYSLYSVGEEGSASKVMQAAATVSAFTAINSDPLLSSPFEVGTPLIPGPMADHNITETTAGVTVQAKGPATVYYMVSPASDWAGKGSPTATEVVLRANGSLSIPRSTENDVGGAAKASRVQGVIVGLQREVAYKVWVVLRWSNWNYVTPSVVVRSFTTPDLTPPVLWSVNFTDVAETQAKLRVALDEPGMGYYILSPVVVTRDAAGRVIGSILPPVPTAYQVRAGTDASGAVAVHGGTLGVTTVVIGSSSSSSYSVVVGETVITGLTAGTNYSVFVTAADDAKILVDHRNYQTTVLTTHLSTPDTTPPSSVSGYPKVNGVGETGANLTVTFDEAAWVYYMVGPVPSGSALPAVTSKDVVTWNVSRPASAYPIIAAGLGAAWVSPVNSFKGVLRLGGGNGGGHSSGSGSIYEKKLLKKTRYGFA